MSNQWYVGPVYSGGKFVGFVCGQSRKELTCKASKMCNQYNNVIDVIKLQVYEGDKIIGGISCQRTNKKSPNNEIIRGQWI